MDLGGVGFIELTNANETYGDFTFKARPKINGVRELQFEGFILHAPDTPALALAVRDAGLESTDLLNKIEEQLHKRKVTLTLP